jgi:hypothetical protein
MQVWIAAYPRQAADVRARVVARGDVEAEVLQPGSTARGRSTNPEADTVMLDAGAVLRGGLAACVAVGRH